MEKSPSVRSYSDDEELSNTRRVRAIVEWPNGLEGPLRIFPLAESFEEAERVEELLKKRLTNSN